MKRKLKFVIVGFGNMGRDWVNFLKKRNDVKIVGVVDVLDKSLNDAINILGLDMKSVGNDLKKVIGYVKPDAVINTSPPFMHKEVVSLSMKLGCHVLGEKPMALNLVDARKLIKQSNSLGLNYMLNQNYRWNPMFQHIRKIIKSGKIGNIQSVTIDYSQNFNFNDTFRYRMDNPLLVDMAIHHFDLVRSIAQEEFNKVFCVEYNTKGSRFKSGSSASAIFKSDSGAVFNYYGSWADAGGLNNFMGKWKIVGDKGALLWDGNSDPVFETLIRNKLTKMALDLPKNQRVKENDVFYFEMGQTLDRFIKSIKTGEAPETWCGDNIKTLAMVISAIDSSKKGSSVVVTNR